MKTTRLKLSYLAGCTLLALSASATAAPHTAMALAAQAQAAQQTQFQLDLPAQDTNNALLQLAEETNSQIIFEPGLMRGKNSPAVQGNLTVEQAIAQLLQDTGLTFARQGSNTFVVTSSSTGNSSRLQDNLREQLGNAEGEAEADVERIQVVGSNIRGAALQATSRSPFLVPKTLKILALPLATNCYVQFRKLAISALTTSVPLVASMTPAVTLHQLIYAALALATP